MEHSSKTTQNRDTNLFWPLMHFHFRLHSHKRCAGYALSDEWETLWCFSLNGFDWPVIITEAQSAGPSRGKRMLLQWLHFKINKTIHTRKLLGLAIRADHYCHTLKQVPCHIKNWEVYPVNVLGSMWTHVWESNDRNLQAEVLKCLDLWETETGHVIFIIFIVSIIFQIDLICYFIKLNCGLGQGHLEIWASCREETGTFLRSRMQM